MLGLTLNRHRQRPRGEDTVQPRDVPGFSKWVAAEVYVHDKLAESTMEKLSITMGNNIDWINNVMNEIDDIDNGSEDMSFMLLKSPNRKSPMKKDNTRELEIMKTTTSMILDEPPRNIIEELHIPTENIEDSFDLISKDIRKSYAAKQKTLSPKHSVSVLRAEEEIKELSRLIDAKSDDSDDDDDNNNNDSEGDITMDRTNKIDTISKPYQSPIKFPEMPQIEPLTLGSTRKKSQVLKRRKDTNKEKERERERDRDRERERERVSKIPVRSSGIISKPFGTPTVFRETLSKDNQRRFELNPLPNATYGTENTSMDEPTIKLDRKKVIKQERERERDTIQTQSIKREKIPLTRKSLKTTTSTTTTTPKIKLETSTRATLQPIRKHTPRISIANDWFEEHNLEKLLEQQRHTDPVTIFGKPPQMQLEQFTGETLSDWEYSESEEQLNHYRSSMKYV